MPFPFRRCFGNSARQIGDSQLHGSFSPRSNVSLTTAEEGCRADGHVECKLMSMSGLFKKEPWTVRFCVIRHNVLIVYKNEAREQKLFSANLTQSVEEFSASYRLARQLKTTTSEPWPKLECIFTFVTETKDKIKLRVHGEQDAFYWMTKLCKVFNISPCLNCAGSGKAFSQFEIPSFGRWHSSPRPSNLETSKLPFSTSAVIWPKPKVVSSPLVKGDSVPHREEKDFRHQLATEFIDALRRTDSMLEGRQTALRSQLEAHRVADAPTMVLNNGVITDHEEEVSQGSSHSTSSAATDRERAVRPSSILRPRQQVSTIKSRNVDETVVGPATMIAAMPTIIDDHDNRSEAKRLRSEVQYTSSAFIRLGDRRPPIQLATIDYSGIGSSTSEAPSTNRIAVSSASTATNSTLTYSMSSSKTVTSSTAMNKTGAYASVPPLSSESMATFHELLKHAALKRASPKPPAPPPPPPPPLPQSMPPLAPMRSKSTSLSVIDRSKASESISSTPVSSYKSPMLPMSFLSELREAALKRQMSMNSQMSSFRG